MKVLQKGTIPVEQVWKLRTKCTGYGNGEYGKQNRACGAELELEFTDLYVTTRCRLSETWTYITFECCECGAETDIPYDAVPQALIPKIPLSPHYVKQREEVLREELGRGPVFRPDPVAFP